MFLNDIILIVNLNRLYITIFIILIKKQITINNNKLIKKDCIQSYIFKKIQGVRIKINNYYCY